jgi:hypothetical protein
MASAKRDRGQALVLLALFLLVLVVATLATLSLSHLTQQKMEMQVANDAAAYSHAVATARTFNSVALLNRAQVATMVAMQGIHSAISFAGSYRAAINATMYGYEDDFNLEFCNGVIQTRFGSGRHVCELFDTELKDDQCPRAKPLNIFGLELPFICTGEACRARDEIFGISTFLNINCRVSEGAINKARVPLLKDEWCRIREIWNRLDDTTGRQGKRAQGDAIRVGETLELQAFGRLTAVLQPLARRTIGATGALENVSAAEREVSQSYAGGGSYNGLEAVMGSRAHPFISSRYDGDRAIEDQIHRVIAPSGAGADEVRITSWKGNSYFDERGAQRYMEGDHGRHPGQAYASWADEHGIVSVNYLGQYGRGRTPAGGGKNLRSAGTPDRRHALEFAGSQSSTDEQNRGDTHFWCPQDLNAESRDPALRHTLLPHRMPPPNEYDPCSESSCIWPGFFDINAALVWNPAAVFGQPKLLTVATKDLAGQHDPWNLFFRFRFSPSGAGAQTNLTAKHELVNGIAAPSGVTPELQSLSAGLAYYHRPGHWKEHPNLFNPYWRATLVRANIDASWKRDLDSSVAGAAAATLTQLQAVGYQGIP